MGCENWREVALGDWVRSGQKTPKSCGELCAQTSGCQAFGFQKKACNGTEQAALGACFLWSGRCHMEANQCWDNYRMEQSLPMPWALDSQGTGCANHSMMMANQSAEWNADACGRKCEQSAGCRAFNFQPEDCKGPDASKKGACSLFSGVCERTPSTCLDYYLMDSSPASGLAKTAVAGEEEASATFVVSPDQAPQVSPAEVPEPASKGSTPEQEPNKSRANVPEPAAKGAIILRVDHLACWNEGDKITINDNGVEGERGQGTFGRMINTIASVRAAAGTLQLEVPLAYPVPRGATVAKLFIPPPTGASSTAPTRAPTPAPTPAPTRAPTQGPTQAPTKAPTQAPGPATASVTEDAAEGSNVVKVDDISGWSLQDVIQISVDRGSPKSQTMLNLIESIEKGTNSLVLMYSLSDTVTAGSIVTLSADPSTTAGRY